MTDKKIETVHFLAGSVPTANIAGLCAGMNWAAANKFKVVNTVSALMQANTRIVGQPQQAGPHAESVCFFYCSSTNKNFENYFGETYSEEKTGEYPKKIGIIEAAKKEAEEIINNTEK